MLRRHLIRSLLISAWMLAWWQGVGLAQQVKDTLYMRNGMALFGELKKIYAGWVDFKPDDIALVSLKMSKIKTISASNKRYRIQTINHKEFYSVLRPSERPGYVTVGTDSAGGGEIPMTYIGKLSYFLPGKNLWEGNVSLGYSYTRSSDIGLLTLDGTFKYLMRRGGITATVSSMTSQEEEGWSRDRESLSFNGNHYFNSFWTSQTLVGYQRNLELGLARRFMEGVAAGYNYISRKSMSGDIMTGIVFSQELGDSAQQVQNSAELPVFFTFNFFRFAKPEITLSTSQDLYVGITQKGRIRHDGEIRLEWKIITDFTTSLKFYNSFDNQPLSGAGASTDYGIVFGIGYKFD